MHLYRRDPSGNWWLSISTGDLRVRRSLHTNDKCEAERLAEHIVRQIEQETLEPTNNHAALLSSTTQQYNGNVNIPVSGDIQLFIKRYLNYAKANKAVSSFNRDKITLEKHFWVFLQQHRLQNLADLTHNDLENYKHERKRFVSEKTINRELESIKAALTRAIDWGYISSNPAVKVRKFNLKPSDNFHYYSFDDVGIILKESKNGPSWLYIMILTAYLTGMRRGELCSLKWVDVNWDDSIISINNSGLHKDKTTKPREIQLHARLKDELLRWFNHRTGSVISSDYIFGNGPTFDHYSTKILRMALKRCKLWIEGDGWHTFRHSFAVLLLNNGCQISDLSKLMGHSISRSYELYGSIAQNINKLSLSDFSIDI